MNDATYRCALPDSGGVDGTLEVTEVGACTGVDGLGDDGFGADGTVGDGSVVGGVVVVVGTAVVGVSTDVVDGDDIDGGGGVSATPTAGVATAPTRIPAASAVITRRLGRKLLSQCVMCLDIVTEPFMGWTGPDTRNVDYIGGCVIAVTRCEP